MYTYYNYMYTKYTYYVQMCVMFSFSPADSSQDIENRSWRPPHLPCLLVVHASSRSAPQADWVPGPCRFPDDGKPLHNLRGLTMVVPNMWNLGSASWMAT